MLMEAVVLQLGLNFWGLTKMIENAISNLIKIKSLVTVAVIAVFAVLAFRGDIQPDNVMIIVSMVVSFYFGTQHEKKGGVAVGD